MSLKKVFNPDHAAQADSGIFGLHTTHGEAALVLVPVPWEATTSYGAGTSGGPKAILAASRQVDLFDLDLGKFYEHGLYMAEERPEISGWNKLAKAAAQKIIQNGGNPFSDDPSLSRQLSQALECVNSHSLKINAVVYEETKKNLESGKISCVVGGDHSTPLGALKAYLEKYPDMGVLHVDAHADLRPAYEGFTFSHASIMHNLMHMTSLKKLVQVGIRDFSEGEFLEIRNSQGRIKTFFDQQMAEKKALGENWASVTDQIIDELPREVYISFDIDGLDPLLCPNTGTPVPGGLSFQEAQFLIKRLVESGRHVVGFDLNEVSPDDEGGEWDANVGARLLYKLCGWTLASIKNRR